ncbi:MAG: hypothetical protein HY749_06085 [Gammaproteobacteria bacterium]|nr:hypothetical protein [Gammaproteobacteria bacterium]MBI5617484.1 hypothetical protein [Gammaproteobacteria bacterium]
MRERRRRGRNLRADIANAAARMLVEGEADSFAAAKRKAAAQLGVSDARQAPDNLEVQAAIIGYQRVFEPVEAGARVTRMREAALAAMRFFAPFSPRLVGPVLYGTAFEHSSIALHLFDDEVEAVSRFLVQHGIAYRLAEKTLATGGRALETYTVFEVSRQDFDFELVVMPHKRLIQAPLSPLDGQPYRRMSAAALEALLAEGRGDAVLWGDRSGSAILDG